jgi:hypothetical protein
VWVLVILLLGGASASRSAAQGRPSPRVVAVGDVHGDFDAFRGILDHAGIIDTAGRWIAGNTTLVQTGDLTDRGPKVRAVLDFLIGLEAQAAAAGGRVAVLLGNHETMNMIGDGQDVTPAIYATFADEQSEQRREAAYEAYVTLCAARSVQLSRPVPKIYQPSSKGDWMAAHPLGFVEYRDAFGPQGRYGRWLRTKPTVLRLGDTVFLHGGLHPDRAPRKLEDINTQVRAELKRFDSHRSLMADRKLILPFFTLSEVLAAAQVEAGAIGPRTETAGEFAGPGERSPWDNRDLLALGDLLRIGSWALIDENGPLWFRGFATWSVADGAPQMTTLLRRYGVAHFVVGHTIPSTMRITPRFSAAVFLIDTALSSVYPGGRASALEIRDGRFTAIYAGERTTLFEPGAPRYSARPRRRCVENYTLAPLGNHTLEQLDDLVAAREQGLDLPFGQAGAHFALEVLGGEAAHCFQQTSLAPFENFRVLQLLAESERPRVIDHPHLSIRGPKEVAAVPVGVLNQCVEDVADVNLFCGSRRGPKRTPLLPPLVLIHEHIINPPGDRGGLALDASLDGHRDRVEAQQLGDAIAGDVVTVAVSEVQLLGGLEHGFRNVHRLYLRIVRDPPV